MRIGTPGFVAARLTEAREARGIAQTELAELTGIKSQSICHYEQGRQSPSPEALTLLAEKLLLPEHHFFRPLAATSVATPFFHCMRPVSRVARTKAEHHLDWLCELALYLREYVDFPPVRLPSIAARPDIASLDSDAIENTAALTRGFFLPGAGPIPSMTTLLENHGFIVANWQSCDDESGSWLQSRDGVPHLLLAHHDHHASQTAFAAAHALGHLILHPRIAPADLADAEVHDLCERQADHFARAFLLPARSFGKEVWSPTIDALVALKRSWNCPIGVMVQRCVDLGIFDAQHARRAFANIGRRGWKTDEPQEREDAIETPGLLARSILLLLDSGVKDTHTLLAELALSAQDVEDLATLPRGSLRDSEPLVALAPRLRQAAQ